MDNINENLDFECCFCGEGIESSKVNPADILITTNCDKAVEMQYSQTFFCHVECFYNKLHVASKNRFTLKKYF